MDGAGGEGDRQNGAIRDVLLLGRVSVLGALRGGFARREMRPITTTSNKPPHSISPPQSSLRAPLCRSSGLLHRHLLPLVHAATCFCAMLPKGFGKGGSWGSDGKMQPPVLSPSPLPIPGTHEETPISASRSMDNLSLTDRRRRWCTTMPRAGWETIPQVNPPRYVPLLHVAPMPPMRVLRVHISQRILARKQIFESRP